MVSPTAFAAVDYGTEVQTAYEYAYTNNVTTVDNIDAANPFGLATREQAAKQFVNIAKAINPAIVADDSADCSFVDLGNADATLVPYITEVCQMGIMGQNMPGHKFLPFNTVDRAQVATMLSRIIWGDKYDGGTPWYAAHMEALKDAGIMNNISNPTAPTARYEIWLMGKRTDDADLVDNKPEECQDPMVQLSCALGLSAPDCPVACQDTEEDTGDNNDDVVKEGTLNVSLNSASLADGTQVPSTGIVRFAVVDFSASNSADVSVNTVELQKTTLAAVPSGTKVWFEKDGVRVSGRASFTSDGSATISFAPAYVVKAGNTESLDLYVQLATSANKDFQFKSMTIDSTAISANGGFMTPKLTTTEYTVAPVTIASLNNGSTNNVSEYGLELGAFKLTNGDTSSETRDLNFKSITLRQNGNGDLANLSSIILERNGSIVASNPVVDGRDITFQVSDIIKDGTSASYYIKAVVGSVENSSDTYQFELRKDTDLNVVESTTAFRSTVTPSTLMLDTYTIEGGDLTFVRDADYELSHTYAPGSEVVLMKGTITSKEAVTLEDPTLTGDLSVSGWNDVFSNIYLQIGNSLFSYATTSATGTVGMKFDGTAFVDGTVDVKLYATLKDNAPNSTVKFNPMNLAVFGHTEYVSNGYTISSAVGSIAGISVESLTSTLNVTKVDGLGDSAIAPGTTDKEIYGLRLASNQGNGVRVSRVTLNVTGNAALYNNNVDVTLLIDGTPIKSKTVSGTTIVFDGFNKVVDTDTSVDFTFNADFTETFNSGTFQVSLNSLEAYDVLSSNAVTSYDHPAGAVFTLANAIGTLAASSNNPLSSLFLSPSADQKLVAFKLTASNDSIRLYDLTVTGTNLGALSNYRLVSEDDTVLATATTATTTGLKFENIANAPVIAKDTSANYYIMADVNNNTAVNDVALTVDYTGTNIKGSAGTTVQVVGSNVVSRTHATAENVITLAKAENPNKALTTSALRFTVTAAGKDSVLLTGVTINAALAGYTTSSAKIQVYKTSVTPSNLAGELNYAAGDKTIVMTGMNSVNSTIDAGQSVEYIVVVDSALVDSTATSQDWNVTLKGVQFGGFDAINYNNLGDLPFTEVK